MTAFFVEDDSTIINEQALDKALDRLAKQTAQYISKEMFGKMKEIVANNRKQKETEYDSIMQSLLEKTYVMEYNSGSYKRINPILELSNLYQQNVQ
jgi:hypothetical protein